MSSSFYIPRKLLGNERTYSEDELLGASNFVIVLAEPGGGKTELLGSLAQKLGTLVETANVFKQIGASKDNSPLVIDAFDELAKVDKSGISSLLGKARNANPTHVIISSRSSEWDSAATSTFNDFFRSQPLVVRLSEFDQNEQRLIFDHHVPGENFDAFQAEVARFDLETLLPNPQFLKLFADAYIESNRQFTDKQSIFSQAVERLAREVNPKAAKTNTTLSITQKVDLSSEIFAKLLLSGAEGISTKEASESRIYPQFAALFSNNTSAEQILATRLFKPGDIPDHHRPVHKIVSEYCAAGYLTKRIKDQADPLTLQKCLSIIAPNSTVRDELRGLISWMASLGNKSTQEDIIKLDPYAVLANGDPSQLEPSSKRLLIRELKEVEAKDPYFRRGDYWRRFSVAGFFTSDVVEEIKPLLLKRSDGHLRDLILELLAESPAVEMISNELKQLVLSSDESESTRLLASRCLQKIEGYDHQANLVELMTEASPTSLKVAVKTIEKLGPETLKREFIADLLLKCANLYPGHQERLEKILGSRYFIKSFIRELSLDLIEWLLDDLSKDVSCKCGKKSYECDCRNGISKIIGLMLDRYFELASPPFDSRRVWNWIGNLNFHERKSPDQSKAVQVIKDDIELRHGIIAHVFGKMTDRDQIFETRIHQFDWYSHSGLSLSYSDYEFLVDLAFDNDNPDLWASFMARHQYYKNMADRGPDKLRRHMREQACCKPLFMCEWAKSNRQADQTEHENRLQMYGRSRRVKLRQRQQEEIHEENIKYVQSNRDIVESGRHWGLLARFAHLVLMNPDRIEPEFGDENLVKSALRNCLDFIGTEIPDLPKLAELQCSSKYSVVEEILFAACLEIMRDKGHLNDVDISHLKALRTNIDMGYSAVSQEERDALKSEVDRIIFRNSESAKDFLQQYLEPQLANKECKHAEVWLLRGDEVFSNFRAELSIDWIKSYDDIALSTLHSLFEIAAQFGDRDALKSVISDRCSDIMSNYPQKTENNEFEQKRTFWLVRAWYFLDTVPSTYWDWLKDDRDTVFILNEHSGRFSSSDHNHWPKITSIKVEAILEAFIGKWPKVDLPSNWGTSSPKGEKAYRFLSDVIWSISQDNPDDAVPVLDRLIASPLYVDLHQDLKSIHATHIRKRALKDFEPPTPQEIVSRLDRDEVVTVEGLREIVVQELNEFQRSLYGGEFNTSDRFYENGKRLDERRSSEIISERLNLRLQPKGISIVQEHQLKGAKRSDFTASKMISGRRRLLVTEVKGQWNPELFTAATAQLYERYSIHPDAEHQGIYLVIWFGANEKVAGKISHGITSAEQLKSTLEKSLSSELRGRIDVIVLDVSRK